MIIADLLNTHLFLIWQGDPVRDLVFRYMGEQEAIKRQILSVDSVTQDIDGLKALIVSTGTYYCDDTDTQCTGIW